MVKKKLLRVKAFPYHIVSRTNNQEYFPLPLDIVWKECKVLLNMVSYLYSARVHAFVLMSNHYHLIVSTPEENIDQIMFYFNKNLSERVNLYAGRINRLFGTRYRWSIVDNAGHLKKVIRYLYRNPVKAGICAKVEDYLYSTIRQIIGFERFEVHLFPFEFQGHILNFHPMELLSYLNEKVQSREDDIVGKALRHSVFQINCRNLSASERINFNVDGLQK